ncbi:MAG: glycosyltransferase family 39 protein, partial [Bryobacterales bacterium]|nr:glycosyltransferase family 39 protein [Bryobacterales bacterium]
FSRFIHAWGVTPEQTFLISGILAGALAAWLLIKLGDEWGSHRAGWMAAVLFCFTPIFWFNSLTNQGRAFNAVASAGAAWLCLRASRKEAHWGWLAGAAGFLSTMAGFRPVESLMLAPLLAWAAWKRRPHAGALGATLTAGLLPAAVWGWVLLDASGGLTAYLELLRNYANAENIVATRTAAHPLKAVWKSAEFVGAMHLITFLPWCWAPFLARPPLRGRVGFLAVWVLPGLAFQIFGHAADPCHTLATVTALCWLGGLTLAQISGWMGTMSVVAACCLGTSLFLDPLRGAARATSYSVIMRVDDAVSQAVDTLRTAEQNGPLTIVVRDTLVTWRHLAWYFPKAEIWVVEPTRLWSPSGQKEYIPDPTKRVWIVDRNGIRPAARDDLAVRPEPAQR